MSTLARRVEHLETRWAMRDPLQVSADAERARELLATEIKRSVGHLLAAPAPPDRAHESPMVCWTWQGIQTADDRAPRDTLDWWDAVSETVVTGYLASVAARRHAEEVGR